MRNVKKHEILLTVIWLLAINLHRLFDASGIRADIYLFYDYSGSGRMVSNILYEIGMHLSRLIPSFILMMRIRNIFFKGLFYYLLLDFIAYLLFFGQGTNVYIMLLVLIYIIVVQWKKEIKINGL